MTALAIDPPIGRRGAAFLRRVQLFKAPYPLSLNVDHEQAPHAIRAGYVARVPHDHCMVELTSKGTAYLEKLMRCE